MSNIALKIKKDLEREERRQQVLDNYENKGRRIEHYIYKKLKQAIHCSICGNKYKARQFRKVAHIIPKKIGGGNEEKNLKSAHGYCEFLEDIEKDNMVKKLMEEHKAEKWQDIREIIHKEIMEKYGQRKS